ncbi:MAG: hypothetical protein LBK82_17690 [Planctomycetaceae bacterium]|jgi:hypothetical protein|nr:hypothetical protein [Planctomycetaceae bacterium]
MKKYMILFCAFVFVIGCSPNVTYLPTEHVQGIVTLDGVPLDDALVTFIPVNTDGIAASGYSNTEGIYQLTAVGGEPQKGAVTGDYIVTVNKIKIKMVKTPSPYPGEEPTETAEQTPILHKNYLNAKTSPLKVTVIKGKNKIDLPLTKNGSQY